MSENDFDKMLEGYLPPEDVDLSRPPPLPSRQKQSHPKHWKTDDTLDLHGMTAEQAESALEVFFAKALSMKYRKLLIVHGKGKHSKGAPVLQGVVNRFLDSYRQAGMRGRPPKGDGGDGAVWVALKYSNYRSR